jgi:hypothetical protein
MITHVEWDQMGFGFFYCNTDDTEVTWEPAWTFQEVKQRLTLYHHSSVIGAVWQTVNFPYYEQSLICSASSDGSIRGGFVSALTVDKPPALSLFQFYKIADVKYEGLSSPSNDTEDEGTGMGIIIVQRKEKLDQALPAKKNEIEIFHSRAIHCIDHVMIDDSLYGQKTDLLLFGGASGFLVMKVFNLLTFEDFAK